MPMFVFKTPEFIWIAEGIDGEGARAELVNAIHTNWTGEVALSRETAVRQAAPKRVPQAVSFIRTFPLSDMEVY